MRPINVLDRILQYDCARQLDVGVDHAGRLLRAMSAEEIVGASRVKTLTQLATGKNAMLALALLKQAYHNQRREGGFRR